jgi:8-oxo-dGTP pyrophosphatase MutT (NUDIX family)
MVDRNAAIPIPSATLLMLRDGPDGLEVFMVVRHHQIDFASGALVFPGGKADPQDFDPALTPFLDGAAATTDLRAIQVSAIREAFEECGILLARRAGSDALISAEQLLALEPYRNALHRGSCTLVDFVAREQLRLACDQLVHFAHWVTPETLPKRFDTHFFLAAAPADHLAVHDGHESVDSVWIRPADALAEAERGVRTIIFPTLRNVEKLADYPSVAAAIADARASTIVTILPWMERRDDGTYVCIPRDAGYAVTEERVPDRPA